jgi:single-strand DNA-binding protein
MSNTVTVVGNLARDPELKFTPNGKAVVTLSVADTPRSFNKASGAWENGVTDWVKVVAWEALAENIGASLKKGDQVFVQGRYVAEKYNDKETNEEKTSRKLVADVVGPTLQFATATVQKAVRSNNGGGNNAGGGYTAPAVAAPSNDDMPF